MKAVLLRQTNFCRWLLVAAVVVAALAWPALALAPPAVGADRPAHNRPDYSLGYTVHRTNLPGHWANRAAGRAFVIKGDGSGAKELAPELAKKPHQHTQFGGWSPDGRQAWLYQM
jgi:hypothetical protein